MEITKTGSRVLLRIIALMLACLILLGALFSASADEEKRDLYVLNLDVLPDEQTVRVTQSVTYTNRTGRTLDYMMFSVYANILRRQSTVPVESSRLTEAFPEGYAPGGVDFMKIEVNGEQADWGVQGSSELFLRVECSMEPGETAQFGFEYYLLLPVYSGAMGVGDLGWRLTNFYPVAAVWDEYLEDFPLNGYTVMNEPLFSEAADYQVTLSLPETYALAAPGLVTAVPDGEGMVDYEIRAESIRELALMFSRKMFEKTDCMQSGASLCVQANSASKAARILNTALPVVNWLEEKFGAYPWPCLTIAETDCLSGGLSYPAVIQVSKDLSGSALDKAVVNLCVKQYFSAIVGSSRNGAPWLSEAVSSFVSLLYYEEQNGYDDFIRRLNDQVLHSLQITVPGGVTVDSPSERFASRMEYEIVAVDRGTAVLYEMRQVMGEDVFMEALAEYVRRMAMKNAAASDFLSAMNDISGERWDEYLYGQMHSIDEYVGLGLEWFE